MASAPVATLENLAEQRVSFTDREMVQPATDANRDAIAADGSAGHSPHKAPSPNLGPVATGGGATAPSTAGAV